MAMLFSLYLSAFRRNDKHFRPIPLELRCEAFRMTMLLMIIKNELQSWVLSKTQTKYHISYILLFKLMFWTAASVSTRADLSVESSFLQVQVAQRNHTDTRIYGTCELFVFFAVHNTKRTATDHVIFEFYAKKCPREQLVMLIIANCPYVMHLTEITAQLDDCCSKTWFRWKMNSNWCDFPTLRKKLPRWTIGHAYRRKRSIRNALDGKNSIARRLLFKNMISPKNEQQLMWFSNPTQKTALESNWTCSSLQTVHT